MFCAGKCSADCAQSDSVARRGVGAVGALRTRQSRIVNGGGGGGGGQQPAPGLTVSHTSVPRPAGRSLPTPGLAGCFERDSGIVG